MRRRAAVARPGWRARSCRCRRWPWRRPARSRPGRRAPPAGRPPGPRGARARRRSRPRRRRRSTARSGAARRAATPKRASSSGSHSTGSSRASSVRDALVASVTCASPPVRFQASQLSTVPKGGRPSPSTRASSHSSLVAEKYGSGTRPVRSRIEVGRELAAALRRPPVLPDDRGCERPPVAAPDDRRLALVRDPDRVEVGGGDAGVARAHRAAASWTVLRISSGSCSTQPGCGIGLRGSRGTRARRCGAASSTTRQVVPVVPWSIARITRRAPPPASFRAGPSAGSSRP